jgi:MoxR-like ATPase
MNAHEPVMDLAQAHDLATRMRREVAKALVGQEAVVEQVVVAFLAGGHVLLEGVPGLGKTLLVRALARTFEGRHARIQFTPDLMPSDIMGHSLYDMGSGSFSIRRGPVFTNLLLADEINRAPAKTQSALLEVMQERQVSIEGQSLPVDAPFMVLATQNPIESEGTYPLPEAQLDRFLLKVFIDYPAEAEEARLVRQVTHGRVGDDLQVEEVAAVAAPAHILAAQRAASTLTVDDAVVRYAVQIVRATRGWPGVALGAGPRGAIALVRTARAAALLAGRDFVTPDDVKAMARPALRHRLTPSPEVELEGHTVDGLLEGILEKVQAPRS